MKRSDVIYEITKIIENKVDDLGFFATEDLAKEIIELS